MTESNSTALATRDVAQVGAVSAIARLDARQIDVIKQTVAKGASDNELAMFLELAQRYQLDPFAREIWCVDMGGGSKTIMAGRDGYLAIANRHPAFDGMESDVVREGDTFSRSGAGVEHSYGAKRGNILGAYALVHRTDRTRPAYFFAPFAEYNSSKSAWKSYPSAMIIKVAESMALKRAFSISGLVTQEEMDKQAPATATAGPVETPTWKLRWEQVQAQALAAEMGTDELKRLLKEVGIASAQALDDDDLFAKAVEAVDAALDLIDGEVVEPDADADAAWEESAGTLPGTESTEHRDPS